MIIIYNPTAGAARATRLWRVLDILSANGVRVQLAETAYPGHATHLARQSLSRNPNILVVAAGGDGTIAEVANGLSGCDARMGVIPLGTANVLARELSLPTAPHAVAAALVFGRTRTLWPGLATGQAGERLFVQMLGVGLDAQVVHRLPRPLKKLLGRSAYVLQTLREAWRYAYTPIRLKIDGTRTQAASVIVTKGTLYAGQYMLAPAARPSEPGFSVALFNRPGPLSAMMYGAALPLNLLPHAPGLKLLRANHVEIEGTPETPAQADGDAAGATPLTIRNAPHPIRIIIS